MLDLKFVRENPEVVKQNIRNKFQDAKLPMVDEVIELERRTVLQKQKQTVFVHQEINYPSRSVS